MIISGNLEKKCTSADQTLGRNSSVVDALDRLGERLAQQCGDGGLASRVASLEERINQLHMQLAGFNISRYVLYT